MSKPTGVLKTPQQDEEHKISSKAAADVEEPKTGPRACLQSPGDSLATARTPTVCSK